MIQEQRLSERFRIFRSFGLAHCFPDMSPINKKTTLNKRYLDDYIMTRYRSRVHCSRCSAFGLFMPPDWNFPPFHLNTIHFLLSSTADTRALAAVVRISVHHDNCIRFSTKKRLDVKFRRIANALRAGSAKTLSWKKIIVTFVLSVGSFYHKERIGF